MTKNFEINDILNAVDSISKLERKKDQKKEVKIDYTNNNGLLSDKNQAKFSKGEILVLDKMIE